MNEENFYLNVARNNEVAGNAVTVDNVYSSRENDGFISVACDDGNTYDVAAWGHDNQMPYRLKEMVENNTVMSQDKFFNVLTCYGRGLEYMDIATYGKKHPQPTRDYCVRRFLMRNNMKRFLPNR